MANVSANVSQLTRATRLGGRPRLILFYVSIASMSIMINNSNICTPIIIISIANKYEQYYHYQQQYVDYDDDDDDYYYNVSATRPTRSNNVALLARYWSD